MQLSLTYSTFRQISSPLLTQQWLLLLNARSR